MKPKQWMQIAAVASAVGLAGTAIANDTQMSSAQNAPGNEGAASAMTQATPPVNGNAAADLDNSPSAVSDGTTTNGNAAADLNNSAAKAGSADASSGSAATSIAQGDRVTRQEFLDEMGRRFDALDTQHRGSLTPYEIDEILVVTAPANASTDPSGTSSRENALQGDTSSAAGIDGASNGSSSSSLAHAAPSAKLGNASDTAPSSSIDGGASSMGTSGASDGSSSASSISR